MCKYVITNKAVADLTSIWNYTYDYWSERQANSYYKMLLDSCQKIANNPSFGKKYEEVTINLQGVKVGKHIIFYSQIGENKVEIIRILHEQMDFENRIVE